jgi:hypothetical protein
MFLLIFPSPQDMEGNDMDTRRRCACDLVKGMAKQFEAETTQLCGAQITTLLAAYDASPATEWRKKDAAVQVLLVLLRVFTFHPMHAPASFLSNFLKFLWMYSCWWRSRSVPLQPQAASAS